MSDDLAAVDADADAKEAPVVAPGSTQADALADAAAAAAAAAHAAGMTIVPPAAELQEDQDRKKTLSTPRRQCRFPGCTKTIKSQGHCQKHGAKAKRCKIEGCDKQAQGTHDGMCKRHWKEEHQPQAARKPQDQTPNPQGPSVYDVIIPASVAWKAPKKRSAGDCAPDDGDSALSIADALNAEPMPIVAHLRNNVHLEPAWHRNQERLSRGIRPVPSPSAQFESWERQLVMFEIMLLSGIGNASHRDLAHAWGREKGFHNVLVSQICERRGEVERKKRSDTGKLFSPEQKASFKDKLNRARANKRAKTEADVAQAAAAQAGVLPEAGAEEEEEHYVDASPEELPPANVDEMAHETTEDNTASV